MITHRTAPTPTARGTLGPVPGFPSAPRRPAGFPPNSVRGCPLSALSGSAPYVRYEDDLPRTWSGGAPTGFADRTRQTPRRPPSGRTTGNSEQALGGTR